MQDLIALRTNVDAFGTLGQARMKLCLDVTLYYEGGFRANAAAVQQFYESAQRLVDQPPRFFGLDGSNSWKPVTSEVLDSVRCWSEQTQDRRIYGLRLECGPTGRDVSDSSIRLYDNGRYPGLVRLTLPVERVRELPAIAYELAGSLRFSSGHAGLSVNMASDFPASLPEYPVLALSRRYRGIDFGDPVMFSSFIRYGLKRVGFITLIGNSLAEKIGGTDALRLRLKGSPALRVVDLANGIAIQAGTSPPIGDLDSGDRLPLFHDVGRIVRDLRFPACILRGYDGIGGTENTAQWLTAFDEG